MAAAGSAAAQPLLAPLDGPGRMPPPPWREVLLPKQTLPTTRFEIVDIDGQRALRIESPASYGNLVHELALPAAAAHAAVLALAAGPGHRRRGIAAQGRRRRGA